MTISPEQTNVRSPSPLSIVDMTWEQADTSPEFGSVVVGPHARMFVHTGSDGQDGSISLSGNVYPLEKDPDGWRAFLTSRCGDQVYKRTLEMAVDRESIAVGQNAEGIHEITATIKVDKTPFACVATVDEQHWLEEWQAGDRERLEKRVDNFLPNSHRGSRSEERRVLVRASAEDIEKRLQHGHYYPELFEAALTAFEKANQ